jgi:hypothetical protein
MLEIPIQLKRGDVFCAYTRRNDSHPQSLSPRRLSTLCVSGRKGCRIVDSGFVPRFDIQASVDHERWPGPPQYTLIVEPWSNGMAYRLTIERTGQFERESTCSSSTSRSTLRRSPSLVNDTPPPNVPTVIQGRRNDWTPEEKPT